MILFETEENFYSLEYLFSLLFLLVKLFISSQIIHIFVQPACVAPPYQLNTTSMLYITTHIQTTLQLHCPLPYAFLLTQISVSFLKRTFTVFVFYLLSFVKAFRVFLIFVNLFDLPLFTLFLKLTNVFIFKQCKKESFD